MYQGLHRSYLLIRLLAFGPTVAELDISDAAVNVQKTKFSMYLPEVVSVLEKNKTKSILLLGIEVRILCLFCKRKLTVSAESCLCSPDCTRIT